MVADSSVASETIKARRLSKIAAAAATADRDEDAKRQKSDDRAPTSFLLCQIELLGCGFGLNDVSTSSPVTAEALCFFPQTALCVLLPL